jgi:hypothetical protein
VWIWSFLGCVLSSLQIIVASCERDEWGGRVARRIPRGPLRVPAFLFYSGAAGGIAFGVIGAVLSVVGMAVWYQVVPTTYGDEERVVLVASLIAGYTYCFCLTAILFRRLLADSGFRAGYTWVIGILLFGLACTGPYIIRFALFDRYSRYSDDIIALYLPNPVVMIDDATRHRHDSHFVLTIVFLMVWGGFATVLNAPWFVKQLTTFRPPRAEKPKPEPEKEADA